MRWCIGAMLMISAVLAVAGWATFTRWTRPPLRIKTIPAVPVAMQSDLARAALARDFEALACTTRDSTLIRLARATCPQFHAAMASILLTDLDIASSATLDLPRAIAVHSQAQSIVKSHLGQHHPYQLAIAERFTQMLELRACDQDTSATWEALRVRQLILADSSKILGKAHACTKSQYKEMGGLQLRLGEWDAAVISFKEARKHALGVEAQTDLGLKLADAYRAKDDIDAALVQVEACRSAIEKELPRSAGPESRPRLLKLQEDVLLRLAKLSQAVAGEEEETTYSPTSDAMISADMQSHLRTAISCYERLFESQRARADSASEGQALLSLLHPICQLTLKLAPPAARSVIRLAARQNGASSVEDKVMHDIVVKLMGGPVSPTAYLGKLLEKAVLPETMKEAEQELRAVLHFITSV